MKKNIKTALLVIFGLALLLVGIVMFIPWIGDVAKFTFLASAYGLLSIVLIFAGVIMLVIAILPKR